MSRSKDIGTAVETGVVKYLTGRKFNARRVALAGANDQGDVHVTKADGSRVMVIECKGGKQTHNPTHKQVIEWHEEAEKAWDNYEAYRYHASLPPPDPCGAVLVMKRKGTGAANAQNWWVVMDFQFLSIMRSGPQRRYVGPSFLVHLTLGDLAALMKRSGY